MRLNSKRRRGARKTLCLLAGVSAGVAVQANPQGPTIAAGNVTFANPNATTLEITNSPNAIINWQSFDIGVGETTRFLQQSAASAVLNRVTTQNPSDILGNLVSNGRVFLVNPAGIVIGRDGLIDTAGLVLSTLNISNENFGAGRYEFNGDAGSGQIVNHGYIKTTPGGEIVLLAPRILNAPEAGNEKSGIIESENGELVLAAGYSITITSLDDPDISFEVTAPAGEVVNLGQLIARGGSVEILAGTIRHSGEINADALSVDATGRIVLAATKHIETTATSVISARGERAVDPAAASDPEAPVNPLGAAGGSVSLKAAAPAAEADALTTPAPTTATLAGRIDVTGARGGAARVEADSVTVQGTIDASGRAAGGTVQVLGDAVKAEGATLRANADLGAGGDIRFGGEFRGADTLRAADSATVDGGSRFEANATTSGDGGEVVIWSDLTTVFAGKVEARGGITAGDGGMIEISGKDRLQFSGGADVGAPRGDAGTLLLDPRNIRIVQGGATVSVDNPTPFAGDQFGSSFEVLSNGNILVVNQGADAPGLINAGEITLLSSSGSVIGSLNGNAANEQLGSFGALSAPGGNRLFLSPNSANGGLAQAGAVILFDLTSGREIGRTSGGSANEQFGALTTAIGNNFIVRSSGADVGGLTDAGAVVTVNGSTGLELGRVSGQSANEFLGSTVNFFSTGANTFLIRSQLADVGGNIDAGAVILASTLTGIEIGRVSGAAAGDQFGQVVDLSAVGIGKYLIRSATADVGGLTDNGTAVLVDNTTGLEIGRTSGLANGDALGSFAPLRRASGNYFLQVPGADIGANTNAGSLVLVNGTSGTAIGSVDGNATNEQLSLSVNGALLGLSNVLLTSTTHTNGAFTNAGGVFMVADVGIGGAASGAFGSGNILRGATLGTSTGEQLGSAGVIMAVNGNYWIPSTGFEPTPSTPNVGSVILADGTTGNEIGRFDGTSSNEQFGSGAFTTFDFLGKTVSRLASGDLLVLSTGHAGGNGIVAQLAPVDLGGGVIRRNSVDGQFAGDLLGASVEFLPSSGNYIVIAPNADTASNSDAGRVIVVDGATGSALGASVDGDTGSEKLGQNVEFNLFRSLGLSDHFAILSAGHGANSEGAIFFVDGATGALLRQVDGNTSDTLGSQPLALVPGSHIAIRNPFSDVGGSDAGEILFVNPFAGYATSGSVLGISANEQLGGASTIINTSSLFGNQFLIHTPLRDVSGKTDAGAVLLMEGSFNAAVTLQGAISGLEDNDRLGTGGANAVRRLFNGNIVLLNPDGDDPTGTPGVQNDEGAVILASSTLFSEIGRFYGQTGDGERLGSGAANAVITERPNGNFLIRSQFAGANDEGALYLVDGATGLAIGRADGTTPNENFGSNLNAFMLTNGDVLVQSQSHTVGGNANAGTVVQIVSDGSLGGGNIVRGRIDGGSVGEQLGQFGATMTSDGTHYFVRSPFADVGGHTDAGSIYFVDATTGALANRLDGQSANEGLGSFSNTTVQQFGANLYVSSRLADAGAVADAGRAIVATQAGAIVGQLFGNNANEQLGSFFQTVGSNIWVFAPLHNNGGLTAAGAIFSIANQDLGGTIVRNSLFGSAAGDNLGAHGADFVSSTTRFVRVPLADVAGMSDAGAAILVNDSLQEIGRTTGTSANEQFSAQSFTSLSNGNFVFPSRLADVNGLVDAGVVKLVSRTTGTLIGQTAGTSANEQFGSSGIQPIGNNGYLVISTGADVGGLVDAGAVVQISQDTGLEIQRAVGVSAGEQFGSFGYTPVGGRFIFRSPLADIGGITDAGRLVFFDPTTANQGGTQSSVFFGTDASGDFVITTGAIANALNSGATLILESNNDITLDFGATLTATGGKLSLRAGRSVAIKGLLNLPDTDIEITVGENQQGIDLQNRGSGASEFRMVDPQLVGRNVSISADLVTLTGGSTPAGSTPLPWKPIDAISFFKDFQLHGTAYPATFVLGLQSLKVTAGTIELTGGDAPGAFAALVSLGGFQVDAGSISLVPGTEPGAHAVFLGLGGQGDFEFDSCVGCGSAFLYTDPFLQAGAPVSGFFVTGLIQNLALDGILSMLDREEDEDTRKKRCN